MLHLHDKLLVVNLMANTLSKKSQRGLMPR